MEGVQESAGALVATAHFEADSGTRLLERASDQECRYRELSEETTERRERCEEATAALQTLMDRLGRFQAWLGTVEAALEERRKEKKPIGTLQTVLEEHYVSGRVMGLPGDGVAW